MSLAGESSGADEDLLVLFPWLGDAFDKKHGLEASSALDGEAVHTGAAGQEERTPDFRTRVLQRHGTVGTTGSAYDAVQGCASTAEASRFLSTLKAPYMEPSELTDFDAWRTAR